MLLLSSAHKVGPLFLSTMLLGVRHGLSRNAVAELLGVPSSSLSCWVRQAGIDRGHPGARSKPLNEERTEFA